MTNLFEFIVGLVNFVLLAFLLWKLFGRTVKTSLAEREQEIKSKVQEAEAMYADAKGEFDKYRGLVDNLEAKKNRTAGTRSAPRRRAQREHSQTRSGRSGRDRR